MSAIFVNFRMSGVKTFMRHIFTLTAFSIIIIIAGSCRKDKKTTECFPDSTTIRQITNKSAVVKLTATVKLVYIIEQGSIDTKLIPCNFPMEFYQNNLQVIISGEVKSKPQGATEPCCTENLVITKITK